MNENSIIKTICPECGEKIELNCNRDYAYCPICTSKILMTDAKNKNLSKDLIKALSVSELDALIKDAVGIEIDKLEIASQKGSVVATIKAGSYYMSKSDYTEAKAYFDLADSKKIPDGKYGSMVCSLKIGDTSNNGKIMNSIKRFNMSSIKYFTKEDLDILKDIVDGEQDTLELAESIKNMILATTPKPKYVSPGVMDNGNGPFCYDKEALVEDIIDRNRSLYDSRLLGDSKAKEEINNSFYLTDEEKKEALRKIDPYNPYGY